jgi:hypothetical protein
MPPRAQKPATYKGLKTKPPPSPTPSKNPEEEDELDSSSEKGDGLLLDEMEEPISKAPSRPRGKPAGPAKSILKKSTPTPASKRVAPGITTATATKSKNPPPSSLAKAVVDKPVKAKQTRRAYTLSQFDSDAEEEEEKVEGTRKEEKVDSIPKSKLDTKAPPKTTAGKKTNSSKFSSSGESSGPSSPDDTTSSNTRKNAAATKITKSVSPPSVKPAPKATDTVVDNGDDEDDFGPDLGSDFLEAVDQDLAAKGLSSSPNPPPAKNINTATITPNIKKSQIRFPSSPKPIAVDPSVHNDEPAQEPDEEEQQTSSQLSADPKADDDNDDEAGIESQQPESQRPSRGEEDRSRKRLLADYDTNALADSEGGTAGLMLDDMSSPAKRPKTSASVSNAKVVKRWKVVEEDEAMEMEAEAEPEAVVEVKSAKNKSTRTPAKPKATPKSKKSTAKTLSPTPPLPELDYELLSSSYDKETIQKLLLAMLDACKKCDWYELSLELAADGVRKRSNGGKGKKLPEMISGNDLHALYHHVS